MDFFCPTTRSIVSALQRNIGPAGDIHLQLSQPHELVARSYLSKNLLKKFYDPEVQECKTKLQMEQEALDKFLAVERRLGEITGEWWSGFTAKCLLIAQQEIANVLGKFCLREFSSTLSLSNGASSRLRRKDAHPVSKLGGRPHVTSNCFWLAAHLYWHTPSLKASMIRRYGEFSTPDDWFQVVAGSEQFSVPKTASTVRLAAKEPELNLLFQKSIGTMIRRRLKRVGIDLNDDTTNQRYAQIGSRTGSLATLDLASASDSVSMKLVRLLLPLDWERYVGFTRSPSMKLLNGESLRLKKVSTMGNGFTFELESLIFWALARACQHMCSQPDKRLTVFGDDIVMHHEPASLLAGLFPILGFEVNRDKSFLDGPFRESCGGHYYLGRSIKPFYLHKGFGDRQTRPNEVAFLINNYLLWCLNHEIQPNLKMCKWLLQTFAPGTPVVPLECDPRCGVYGPPLSGVYFSLRRSGYVYKTYSVGAEKTRKRLTSATALAAWFTLGAIPGRSDRLRDGLTTVYAEPYVNKRLRTARSSRWSYPQYPPSWMDSLFE